MRTLHVGLRVSDLERGGPAGDGRRPRRAGRRRRGPGSPDGSADFLTAWLTDPDGCRIELVQWPAGHPVGLTRADFPEPPPVTR